MEYAYIKKVDKLVIDVFFEHDFNYAFIGNMLDRDTKSYVEVYYRHNADHPLSYLFTCSKN